MLKLATVRVVTLILKGVSLLTNILVSQTNSITPPQCMKMYLKFTESCSQLQTIPYFEQHYSNALSVQALGVVRVRNFAGTSRAAGCASPANAAALAVERRASTSGLGWGSAAGWCAGGNARGRWGWRGRRAAGADGDGGAARALVSLSGDDLVVERAHRHAERLPSVEVRCGVDGAARAVRLADGPVLVEGRGALDRRLVDTRRLVDVVGRAVRDDGALERETAARVVCAEVLDDVVLDERARGPAVQGQVRVARGVIVGGVGDGSKRKDKQRSALAFLMRGL